MTTKTNPQMNAALGHAHQTPVNVFLSGFFGVPNVGDEAVCLAVLTGLRRHMNCGCLSVVTRSASVTRAFLQVEADFVEGFFPHIAFWRRFGRFIRSVARSQLIVVGGGGILQDVHSWTTITTHLFPACLGIALGRPAVTVGIGAGPIRRYWLRKLTGAVCSMMASVQVRDRHSKQVLRDVGVPHERIEVTADVVPSLAMEGRSNLAHRTTTRPQRIGFALRKWPRLNEDGVIALLERLSEQGIEIVLLCYEPMPDRRFFEGILKRATQQVRHRARIEVPETLEDALRGIAQLDALVAMRLHACVFAAYLGVPFVALPYDNKVRMFVEAAGMADRLRSLSEVAPEWAEDIRAVVRTHGKQDAPRAEALSRIREQAERNFHLAAQAVSQKVTVCVRLRAVSWVVFLLFVGLAGEALRLWKRLFVRAFHRSQLYGEAS